MKNPNNLKIVKRSDYENFKASVSALISMIFPDTSFKATIELQEDFMLEGFQPERDSKEIGGLVIAHVKEKDKGELIVDSVNQDVIKDFQVKGASSDVNNAKDNQDSPS